MYFGVKKRILSNALMISALISFGSGILSTLVRFAVRKSGSFSADMLNSFLWKLQLAFSVIQVGFTTAVFIYYWRRVRHYMAVIPAEERRVMGMLQEEYLGSDISALDAEDVSKLLEIWGVILIGAQVVYQISSTLYRRFIEQISVLMRTGFDGYNLYMSIYNSTHGFKYLGMMIAIILGITITGIFLSDRYLKACGVVLSCLFLFVFAVINSNTFSFFGMSIGVVWTSVLFHIVDMAGIILLALYLRKRYPGV